MSNYTKLTDFATKDSLPTGSANKILKGTEIDDELQAIETAVATKANLDSPAFSGTPTAPTAASTTNSTQIATTAFVQTVSSEAVAAGIDNPDADIVINTVTMGDWVFTEDGVNVLNIEFNGTNVFKLDSSGNLTVIGDVTAFGTI